MFRWFRLTSGQWRITANTCHKMKTSQLCSSVESGECTSTKRARLLYQSIKRGILENDIILGGFARSYVNKLNEDQLVQYDRLINGNHNEWDIYYWACGQKPVPDVVDSGIMLLLKEYVSTSVHANYSKQTFSFKTCDPSS